MMHNKPAVLGALAQKTDGEVAPMDTCFERLVGRPMGETERARLYRLRDVLGLRDNDAFWAIIMALEHYDALFREYPERLARVTERTIENVRAVSGATAPYPAANRERVWGEEVARHRTGEPFGIHRVTTALAALVAFGCLCVNAGYELAQFGKPFWMASSSDPLTPSRVLLGLLSVPAGWMMFALMIPAGIHGVTLGWQMVADPLSLRRHRAVGWCIIASCLLSFLAFALVLVRVA
jgi:hypothetical protein